MALEQTFTDTIKARNMLTSNLVSSQQFDVCHWYGLKHVEAHVAPLPALVLP